MGNAANGSKEVTGIGIGSNTHQTAQLIATAAVQHAFASHPVDESRKNTVAPRVGPRARKIRFIRLPLAQKTLL